MNPIAEARGLQLVSPDWLSGLRRVWLHDSSPATDIDRSVGISGRSVPARNTQEVVPSGTVPLVDAPAMGAPARSIQLNANPPYSSPHLKVGASYGGIQ